MNTYVYPVVIEQTEDGSIGMYFPDFPGTAIIPKDLPDGIWRAKEMLAFRLLELEEDGEAFPQPSVPDRIELEDASDRIVFVDVFLPPYRDSAANKAVTKNCTIPKWMRDAGDAAGLNYSQLLQSAIKEALGVDRAQ
ncbi:type II toxin-antitoxin system HicB family antitoxin [Paenibacillus glufosinatiresistens]|uniref:type II toxin-antitoxin system HicB family antitoxin n=1 Tax=Paenibacillus glufosinatiresistens TaxID=3070657 RepID=UPI00286D77E8|nr:type II toxin-antitoxin system HicB family antitoxin [Paenibacillus sp. YX.27]